MKKFISIMPILSIIASIFAMCGVTASAENDSLKYLSYSIKNGEVEIHGCDWQSTGDIIIPDTINGYPVTSIRQRAFQSAQQVISVTIPASVKTIGEDAFASALGMEKYIVDKNSEYFMSDEHGVLYNKDQTELIACPDAITVAEYVIPDGVISVAHAAFDNCDTLEKITIPASLEFLVDFTDEEYIPFELCTNLKQIITDENNQHFLSDENGVLFNKDKTILIKYPAKCPMKEYSIPVGVKTILFEAFGHATNLEKLSVPSSVTDIRFSAFSYMLNLKSVDFNANVELLDGCVFLGCYSLEEIEIPYGVETISQNAFTYGNSLKTVVIPESVITMIDSFVGCYGLESITLPDSVTTMAGSLFADCISLKNVNIPASVKKLENGLFYNCYSLDNVSIPVTVSEIEEGTFSNCLSLKDIYIYNPDVIIGEKAIGYGDEQLIGDIDELKRLLLEAIELSLTQFCQGEEDDSEVEALYEKTYEHRIYLDETVKYDYPVIHGYEGSTAETYAKTYGFKFVPICDHEDTETINAVAADCENDGYTGDVYCNYCEDVVFFGETVSATGHNYIENTIKEATYTQEGVKNTICDNCGDVTEEESIPMLEIEDSEEKEDTDTGVSVIFPEGAFDGNAEIEVTPVEEGEAYKLISHKEGIFKVTMFDINVTVDGQKIQPNGKVLVKIPLPKGYNQNKCVVYYVADDGTMEELKTYHFKDGYVYFETDHFSYYAILEETEVTSDNNNIANDFISYLRSLLNKYISAFLKFIDMIKSLFGMA